MINRIKRVVLYLLLISSMMSLRACYFNFRAPWMPSNRGDINTKCSISEIFVLR